MNIHLGSGTDRIFLVEYISNEYRFKQISREAYLKNMIEMELNVLEKELYELIEIIKNKVVDIDEITTTSDHKLTIYRKNGHIMFMYQKHLECCYFESIFLSHLIKVWNMGFVIFILKKLLEPKYNFKITSIDNWREE